MKNLKDKNNLVELINNFSTLMKYRLGISEPPKKKKYSALAIVGTVSGLALGIAAGLLFATDSGIETRKKLAKSFKDASERTSDYTNKEIARLNEITKEQIKKLKKAQLV